MKVQETAVTNAANLTLFMVNFSYALAKPIHQQNQAFSMLDLKPHYRSYRFATETIKMLPQKSGGILLVEIFQQIASLGTIHPVLNPLPASNWRRY